MFSQNTVRAPKIILAKTAHPKKLIKEKSIYIPNQKRKQQHKATTEPDTIAFTTNNIVFNFNSFSKLMT